MADAGDTFTAATRTDAIVRERRGALAIGCVVSALTMGLLQPFIYAASLLLVEAFTPGELLKALEGPLLIYIFTASCALTYIAYSNSRRIEDAISGADRVERPDISRRARTVLILAMGHSVLWPVLLLSALGVPLPHSFHSAGSHVVGSWALVFISPVVQISLFYTFYDRLIFKLSADLVTIRPVTLRSRLMVYMVIIPGALVVSLVLYMNGVEHSGPAIGAEAALLVLLICGANYCSIYQNFRKTLDNVSQFVAHELTREKTIHEPVLPSTPFAFVEIAKILSELDRLREDNTDFIARLQASEARLNEAQSLERLATWEAHSDGSLIWSEQAYELSGVAPSEFGGTVEFFFDMIHPDDRARVERTYAEALAEGKRYDTTHRLIRPDGKEVVLRQRAIFKKDAEGRPQSAVGICQDITQLVKLEQELRQTQKMEAIGQLTGGIAHDFNNILAIILGNLEVLRDFEKIDASQRELVDDAIGAAMEAVDLTRSMLAFARKAPLQPEIFDLNEVVDETRKWSARILPENIEIKAVLESDLWPVETDVGSTRSALINLILNARDAMPHGGTLTIETANIVLDEACISETREDLQPGRYVVLSVIDDGVGIETGLLEEIFSPFFTTKAAGKGSGLGLSMVHGFMKQSGGAVRVSTELGRGSTFRLYFHAKDAAQLALRKDDEAWQGKVSQARILVVEDNSAVRDTVIRTLERSGYDVTATANGDAALDAYRQRRPGFDLILTDVVMPGRLQGPDLAKEIRALDPEARIIFMSGYASQTNVDEHGLAIGQRRLTKPIRRADLIDAIEGALGG